MLPVIGGAEAGLSCLTGGKNRSDRNAPKVASAYSYLAREPLLLGCAFGLRTVLKTTAQLDEWLGLKEEDNANDEGQKSRVYRYRVGTANGVAQSPMLRMEKFSRAFGRRTPVSQLSFKSEARREKRAAAGLPCTSEVGWQSALRMNDPAMLAMPREGQHIISRRPQLVFGVKRPSKVHRRD